MHDLNTISRLNAEAFADSIQHHRKNARWVLAKYEGLHLVSIETFTQQADAQQTFDAAVEARTAGVRVVLFDPIPAVEPLQPADYGITPTRPADKTLGDYINRKTA